MPHRSQTGYWSSTRYRFTRMNRRIKGRRRRLTQTFLVDKNSGSRAIIDVPIDSPTMVLFLPTTALLSSEAVESEAQVLTHSGLTFDFSACRSYWIRVIAFRMKRDEPLFKQEAHGFSPNADRKICEELMDSGSLGQELLLSGAAPILEDDKLDPFEFRVPQSSQDRVLQDRRFYGDALSGPTRGLDFRSFKVWVDLQREVESAKDGSGTFKTSNDERMDDIYFAVVVDGPWADDRPSSPDRDSLEWDGLVGCAIQIKNISM